MLWISSKQNHKPLGRVGLTGRTGLGRGLTKKRRDKRYKPINTEKKKEKKIREKWKTRYSCDLLC